jgi:hypothetical protein
MHCRDIDVPNANMGQYYLRYPLHPPNGVNITGVQLYVADFVTRPPNTLFCRLSNKVIGTGAY